MNSYPRAFSHVGITVPNIEEAVKFYQEVMGWYVMMKPTVVLEENDTAIGQMCIDVFGEGWGSFKPKHEFNPYQTGIFHFCVKDPDIEGLVEKIVAAGGKQRMPIREYFPGEKPYKMVYCEDPFGNIVEIYTHSYEIVYSETYK